MGGNARYIYRIAEVAVYSLLNFLPFLALALYPFRRSLRFSRRITAALICALTVIQLLLGGWAALPLACNAKLPLVIFAYAFYCGSRNFGPAVLLYENGIHAGNRKRAVRL